MHQVGLPNSITEIAKFYLLFRQQQQTVSHYLGQQHGKVSVSPQLAVQNLLPWLVAEEMILRTCSGLSALPRIFAQLLMLQGLFLWVLSSFGEGNANKYLST